MTVGVATTVTAVDELPDDDEALFAKGDYVLLTDFLAYVRGTRIVAMGELQLTLAVPFEWKYDALRVTDVRGTLMRVVVYKPEREAKQPVYDPEDDDDD